MKNKQYSIVLLILFFVNCSNPEESPYTKSDFTIIWDFASHKRQATGSDLWGVTWSSDDHQYAVWGDGGGFKGSNDKCRVDGTGIARIEGVFDNYKGINRYGLGGGGCENECEWDGEEYYAFNLISINNVLYAFANNKTFGSKLIFSNDFGCTWESANWSFSKSNSDIFSIATFLNMGKDYKDRKDEYVYIYGNQKAAKWSDSRDSIFLSRVPIEKIKNRESYEFYSGVTSSKPIWTKNIEHCLPVFAWPGKVSWSNCFSYAPGIDRILLCFNSESQESRETSLAVFEAKTPWGPWREVGIFDDWTKYGYIFSFWFSPKWWRGNGLKSFTLLFSGTGESDSFNLINGSIEKRKE